jgi:hypothetical protein
VHAEGPKACGTDCQCCGQSARAGQAPHLRTTPARRSLGRTIPGTGPLLVLLHTYASRLQPRIGTIAMHSAANTRVRGLISELRGASLVGRVGLAVQRERAEQRRPQDRQRPVPHEAKLRALRQQTNGQRTGRSNATEVTVGAGLGQTALWACSSPRRPTAHGTTTRTVRCAGLAQPVSHAPELLAAIRHIAAGTAHFGARLPSVGSLRGRAASRSLPSS